MSNHGVQQPIFASATQGSQALGDEIDLNEIFADYFINEFEDPLNAYTSSMANYSGAAAAVALAQKQQQVDNMPQQQLQQQQPQAAPAPQMFAPSTLPTGGIKTSFHTASVASVPVHGNGMTVQEPMLKKVKQEAPLPQQHQTYHQPPPQQQQQHQTSMATLPVGQGGIAGRLGFSVVGGQVSLPHQQRSQPQQFQQVPIQQQQQHQAPNIAKSTGVALPVGVGIRLGGIGGVAPAATVGAAAVAGIPRPLGGPFPMWPGATMAGAMSEQAIAERRQRNREHAKRSRVRKKFMLESLQEQVRGLQKENVELRMLIQEKVPQHAQSIIAECCSQNTLFSAPDEAGGESSSNDKTDPTSLERSDFMLIESLTSGQQNFVLSDPRLPDNPIVYASPGFYVLTGYTQDQVLGRNCRFLQGPGTDPRAVDIIRKAVASGSDATTCLLNYKADGTPFWNQFFVAALRDSDNCIVNFVGVQCEVEPEAGASTVEDKVNSVLPLQNKEGE